MRGAECRTGISEFGACAIIDHCDMRSAIGPRAHRELVCLVGAIRLECQNLQEFQVSAVVPGGLGMGIAGWARYAFVECR